jgi:hypothetical protein
VLFVSHTDAVLIPPTPGDELFDTVLCSSVIPAVVP